MDTTTLFDHYEVALFLSKLHTSQVCHIFVKARFTLSLELIPHTAAISHSSIHFYLSHAFIYIYALLIFTFPRQGINKMSPKFFYIHLLTAIGLTPGGSSTVHIYTQTIHRTTQLTTLVGQISGIRTQSGQTKTNDELTA